MQLLLSIKALSAITTFAAIVILALLEFKVPPESFNLAFLFLIFVGCSLSAVKFLAKDSFRIWFPLPWFLLTSAVYYGFGPMLYYLGRNETIALVDVYYQINHWELARSISLSLLGIGLTLFFYLVFKREHNAWRATGRVLRIDQASTTYLALLATLFLSIGIPIELFFVLPRALGLWDVTLPRSLESLGSLSLLAVVLLMELRRRGKTRLVASLILMFVILLLLTSAAATLSKLAILKVLIALGLALTLRPIPLWKLAIMGVLVVPMYAYILSPLITYGRINYGELGITSISDAESLAGKLIKGEVQQGVSDLNPGAQRWWSRLNYANAQYFAIHAYENGQSGETFKLAPWVLVPRFLYPEKPLMTSGREFNALVTGYSHSHSAPGMLAEGYWNLGYFGLLVVCTVLGYFLSFWEKYTTDKLTKNKLHFIPVMWMGIFAAAQQDSWFIPGTIGMGMVALGTHGIIRTISACRFRSNTY